jgi:hypothetical protein
MIKLSNAPGTQIDREAFRLNIERLRAELTEQERAAFDQEQARFTEWFADVLDSELAKLGLIKSELVKLGVGDESEG